MNSYHLIQAIKLQAFYCFLLLTILIFGCGKNEKKEITTAFYHWKSELSLGKREFNYLEECKSSLLYIRCFDVKWDNENKKPIPNAKLLLDTLDTLKTDVIPVVFIENQVFVNIKTDSINSLAKNCYTLINGIFSNRKFDFQELQFDCDWTEKTKDRYFQFLLEIIRLSENKNLISATIRLHQVKYFDITGIPPVDKGMLMFYNMGKLTDYNCKNSIYNENDAGKYVSYVKQYPLRLDVALPLFSWGICFKSGSVFKIINQLTIKEIKLNPNFKLINDNIYIAEQSNLFRGVYFDKGDRVRVEEISPEVCKKAALQLSENLNSASFTVAFYHLDSTIISIFPPNEIKNIVSTFN